MRLPRWKREQKMRRRQKILPFLRLIFLLVFLSGLSVAGFLMLREAKSSSLPLDGRVTIVLPTQPVFLLSFESQGELTVVSVPEKTYVEVPRGFGSYRIGAVWNLGKLEKLGGKLLAETTQEFLGVPVDGWIGTANSQQPTANSKEEVLALKNNLTSWKILLKPKDLLWTLRNLRTNLTVFDLARVWWRVKNTRFDKVYFVDLGQTSALSPLLLADGSTALTADLSLLDATYRGLFKDTRLAGEHILIEVLNGTGKSGLGQRIARVITNLGGSVISVANSPQKADQCQIRGETGVLKTFTGRRLGQIFSCKMLFEVSQDSRADLQLIIGEDYWQKLYQR